MRSVSLAVLSLSLFGCDSGGDSDGGSQISLEARCDRAGLVVASLSGNATTGTVEAECGTVDSRGGRLDIELWELSEQALERNTLDFTLDDDTEGTYRFGPGEGSRAQYAPSGTNTFDAQSGSITVTEFSATRVAGTFAFTTSNGIEVTEGRFSVPFE